MELEAEHASSLHCEILFKSVAQLVSFALQTHFLCNAWHNMMEASLWQCSPLHLCALDISVKTRTDAGHHCLVTAVKQSYFSVYDWLHW